ncbi:MAG: PHP domain-containing protein [Clostridia bacterium]|nr:PHP domain-containing protein [Clostridia bacterium]
MNPLYDFRWVAHALREIADLSEVLGDGAEKAPAYRRAARAVLEAGPGLGELARLGRLESLPGVGPAIARKIEDILATGTCPLLERLRDRTPEEVVELLELPGIGPATVARLRAELGVCDEESLEAALRAGRLRALPGFGPRREAALLRAIEERRERAGLGTLGEAWPIARELARLAQVAGAEAALEVGALRRREAAFSRAELAAAVPGRDRERWLASFRAALPQGLALADVGTGEPDAGLQGLPAGLSGTVAGQVVWGRRPGQRIALWLVEPRDFGAALLALTGPEAYVEDVVRPAGGWPEALRRVEAAGARSAAYAALDAEAVAHDPYGYRPLPSEAAFFHALGAEPVPPELRAFPERRARLSGWDRLVTSEGWTSELHAHTAWSDAAGTVREMAQAARARGYRVLAITDHSQALAVARGLDAQRLVAQRREIAEVAADFPELRILCGTEADILRDGRLDLPEGVELDWVVASVHSSFRLEREAMTERVCRAVRTGRVHVLGHPTGRLLGRRDGYAIDLEAVFRALAETGTAVEVNASPARLDLGDDDAWRAIAAGLLLAVDTDAHAPAELDDVVYGVWTARRAGARREEVLNTWEPEALLAWASRPR